MRCRLDSIWIIVNGQIGGFASSSTKPLARRWRAHWRQPSPAEEGNAAETPSGRADRGLKGTSWGSKEGGHCARAWLVLQGDQVDVDASNARLKKYRREGLPVVTPVTFGAQGNNESHKGNSLGNSLGHKGHNLGNTGNRSGHKNRVTIEPGESAEQAAVRILAVRGADM